MHEQLCLAVVGSREYAYERRVRTLVRKVARLNASVIILSGGARGVDTWAVDEAERVGLPTEVLPAEWDKYGRAAGMIRNAQLVKRAGKVMAFWDGVSKGTRNTMDTASKAGKLLTSVRELLNWLKGVG